MLHRWHAWRERREHAGGAMGMHGDPFVEAPRLLSEGAHFSLGILGGEAVRARRGGATSRTHLDKICPGFDLGPYGTTDLLGAVGLDAAKPEVSPSRGNALARSDDARADHEPSLHCRPHRKGDAIERATVPDGGHPGAQCRLHVLYGTNQLGFVGLPLMVIKD